MNSCFLFFSLIYTLKDKFSIVVCDHTDYHAFTYFLELSPKSLETVTFQWQHAYVAYRP